MSLRTNGHIVLVSGLHLNTKDKIKKLAIKFTAAKILYVYAKRLQITEATK